MQVEFAFLAEAAMYAENGSLCALGIGTNHIQARGLPIVYSQMAFVFCICFLADEFEQEHLIDVRLVDPEGVPICDPQRYPIRPIDRHTDTALPFYFAQIIAFRQILLARYGQHELRLAINGMDHKTVEFNIDRA